MTLFVRRGRRVFTAAMLCAALAGFGAAVSAQNMDVAVYVGGDFSVSERTVLGTYLLTALVNSGRCAGAENSGKFLTEVYGEHLNRGAVITDGALCEIGKRLDIKYICAATIIPTFGFYKVSARMIYTGTPDEQRRRDGYHDCTVLFKSDAVSHLKTINDLTRVSNTIAGNMFGGNTPAASTESEPAAAAPQSAGAGAPAAATAAAPPAAPAAAPTAAPAASPTAALTAAASLAGEAKAVVDKVVAAVNAFKDATNKSVEAAEAVKTATQAKNFAAAMDAKKKVTAAADAVKKAKADVETAVEALKAAGPEAEAAVKAMGIDIAMFAGKGDGGGKGDGKSVGDVGDYKDFSAGRRWGTFALNYFSLGFGLGSFLLMKDYVGGSIMSGMTLTAVVLAANGFDRVERNELYGYGYENKINALGVSAYVLLYGNILLFNGIRSFTYHKPNPNSSTAANFKPYDGLKLAILPTESGDFKVTARYDYTF